MIRLANGNYAVVWDSATQGGGTIRGAIFNSTGGNVATDFTVSAFSSDSNPQLAALGNGNWVAVFHTAASIYFQIMSPTGTQIGGQGSLGSTVDDSEPAICALNDGGFAIAWTADNGASSDSVWIGVRNDRRQPAPGRHQPDRQLLQRQTTASPRWPRCRTAALPWSTRTAAGPVTGCRCTSCRRRAPM